jgi:hypothetical protein
LHHEICGEARLRNGISEVQPRYGTGQGSGASPAIWPGLVVILLNSLDWLSDKDGITGLTFCNPWNKSRAKGRVGAFVDDTNQGTIDPTGTLITMKLLVDEIRNAGQLWVSLLHISVGSPNLSRCSWILQYWEWKKGRRCLLPSLPSEPYLLLTSGSSPESHIICQRSYPTELKGLGVKMNVFGTFASHAADMKIKFDAKARQFH